MSHRTTAWPVHMHIRYQSRTPATRTWQLRVPKGASRCSFAWTPPTDVFETQDEVLVRVEIAGLANGSADVSFDGVHLVIDGARRDPEDSAAGRTCALKEIASGRFHVDVEIPRRIDASAVEAEYADGFLTVHLPKSRGDAQ